MPRGDRGPAGDDRPGEGAPAMREPGSPAATVRTTEQDGVPVTAVAGEIDADSVAPVRAEVCAQLGRRPDALVLDLCSVSFLGSAGLTMLLDAHHRASRDGVSLAVVAGRRQVLRLLAVTELDHVFAVHPTVSAALAATRPA
ncbi:STAS domain-containing protein [Actinosynnema sp. NPDC004786]